MTDRPCVSIIVPVYNAEKYLADTIRSALNQTWPNKEVIIVDDGSADDSLQIARRFEGEMVKVVAQENKGASAARNAGLKEASGDYIQFLDADDLLSPGKIASQMHSLAGSDAHLSFCRTSHFIDGSEPHGEDAAEAGWMEAGSDNPAGFLVKLYAGDDVMPGYGGMIAVHAWLTPKQLIAKAGLWDERLSLDDDGEFFCRVMLASRGIKFDNAGWCYYRKFEAGGRSLSAGRNRKAMESAVLAIDLKYAHLTAAAGKPLVDAVFARHYWWTGVLAYPQFKSLSAYCIKRAKALNYTGEKYVGGRRGHAFAAFAGWKQARLAAYWGEKLRMAWQ